MMLTLSPISPISPIFLFQWGLGLLYDDRRLVTWCNASDRLLWTHGVEVTLVTGYCEVCQFVVQFVVPQGSSQPLWMAIRIGFCKWEHRTTTWVETSKTLDWYTGQFAGTPSATGEEKLGWCRRWRCSLQPTHWHLWFWDHRIIRVLNTSDPWLSEMRTGWFSGRFTYIETPKITQWWRSIYQKSPSDVGQYARNHLVM